MKKVDLTGKRFGRLLVMSQSIIYGNRKQIKWDCICDCGNKKTINGESLKNGHSKSCGCFRKECSPNITHGLSKSRIYRIYRHMINRCYNKNVDNYYLYGARGIVVCAEWMDFDNFYNWAISNGYKEDLSIDRINVNGIYEPSNCKWSSNNEQARNKRTSVITESLANEIRSLFKAGMRNKDISEKFSICRTTVSDVVHYKTWRFNGDTEKEKMKILLIEFNGEFKMAHIWALDPRIRVSASTILRRKKNGYSDYDALFSPRKTRKN